MSCRIMGKKERLITPAPAPNCLTDYSIKIWRGQKVINLLSLREFLAVFSSMFIKLSDAKLISWNLRQFYKRSAKITILKTECPGSSWHVTVLFVFYSYVFLKTPINRRQKIANEEWNVAEKTRLGFIEFTSLD